MFINNNKFSTTTSLQSVVLGAICVSLIICGFILMLDLDTAIVTSNMLYHTLGTLGVIFWILLFERVSADSVTYHLIVATSTLLTTTLGLLPFIIPITDSLQTSVLYVFAGSLYVVISKFITPFIINKDKLSTSATLQSGRSRSETSTIEDSNYSQSLIATSTNIVVVLIILFIVIAIYKISHTGIGTDEGNFLYTTKLILDGHTLFSDFWARESGSMIFLIPWFSIFDTTISNLRWLVLLLHIFFLLATFKIIGFFPLSRRTATITLALIFVIYVSKILNFYSGIFYQIFNVLFLFQIVVFLEIVIHKKWSHRTLTTLGLLTGLSCLVYRGGVGLFALFILASVYVAYTEKRSAKETLQLISTYLLGTSLPILLYWAYYTAGTDFIHIYHIIVAGYFEQIVPIFILASASVLTTQIILFRKHSTNTDLHILLLNLVILMVHVLLVLKEPNFFEFMYAGVLFNGTFMLATIQFVSLLLTRRGIQRLILASYFTLSNTAALFLGFAFRGYYTSLSHEIIGYSIFIFILYSLLLFIIATRAHNPKNGEVGDSSDKNKLFFICLALSSFTYVIFILGGELQSERFTALLVLSSIAVPLCLHSVERFTTKKVLPATIAFFVLSVYFFSLTNYSLRTDFTLYPKTMLDEAVAYISDLDPNATVFSADTSLLASIPNKNVILFHSPFHFRKEKDVYFYDGIELYQTDISLTRTDMLDRLKETRPHYILGSWRSTFRIFDDPEWNEYLRNNYTILHENGRIKIYEINSY